ncbi:MAG: type I glyceraldehyde-3-phosphate dehydrogenase [Flavobacteriales bacterium]|jgi:glyceraldehyde 3-phosphate dehydrogenase|nr:type I glyceraldehyde-3-phosphate dehydrogenase [Flavobacteriales bacterium]
MRIAINGFGRIGRVLFRVLVNHPKIEIIAINDLGDPKVLTHLLKYDSVHRGFPTEVSIEDDYLVAGKQKSLFIQERNPEKLPWKELNIDLVVESTGQFLTQELANKHLEAGAKKVILSAPPKDNRIPMIVMGLNEDGIQPSDKIISNASCTTNSAAPLIEIVNEIAEIESAYITTVHSYTGDQALHDRPHKDFRRARAGAVSIVPTTTGAAKALSHLFPHLQLGGCGIRVPVPDGSLTDISFVVKNDISIDEINQAFQKASEGKWKGILSYIDDPVVSNDIIGNSYSCVFDSLLTSVIGRMIKVVGWYDNEMGYSHRLKDLIEYLDQEKL